jgi:hypothetical protein
LTRTGRKHRFFLKGRSMALGAERVAREGVIALLRARPRAAGPCPGCPIYPHIPDRELRFPSCELCHWPAVGVGRVHRWRCAFCRHLNEHGNLRPRVAVALLRLATLDAAALRLEVADARCGHFPAPPRPLAHRPRIRRRANGPPGGCRRPAPRIVRRRAPNRGGQPVYARAAVAGLPVLIIGGDRPYPHPLGGNEYAQSPGSLGSRATRIACPCDQPPPCLHAQALYAHVVPHGAWITRGDGRERRRSAGPRRAPPLAGARSAPPGRSAGPRRRG